MTQEESIRNALEAATPGPWQTHGATLVFGRGGNVCEAGDPNGSRFVEHHKASIGSPGFIEACHNAEFITAVNPAAIRDLLEELDRLRADVGPLLESVAALETELAVLRAAAVPAQQWQPIETAPKDGTRFLAWAPDIPGLNYYGVAQWAEKRDDDPRSVAGWFWPYATRPVRWMPILPAAPAPSPMKETP